MQKDMDQAYINRRDYMTTLQKEKEKKSQQENSKEEKFGGYAAFNYVPPVAVAVVEEFPALVSSKVSVSASASVSAAASACVVKKLPFSYSSITKKEAPLKCQQEPSQFTNFTVLKYNSNNSKEEPKENERENAVFQEAVSKAIVGNYEVGNFKVVNFEVGNFEVESFEDDYYDDDDYNYDCEDSY